jgi:hypothetical protein
MAFSYTEFTTTPTNLTADLKTNILLSNDWSNPTANVVKATTTRGAELVVDLAKSAATAIRLGLSVWRVWTGSGPGTGTDEFSTSFLTWRNSGGATSDTLYCVVSVSKEHVYISVEGPKAGDTNAISATTGSALCSFYLGDVVPYHGGDTTPTVCLVTYNSAGLAQNALWYVQVGRDQGATRSWVPGVLASVSTPINNSNSMNLQHYAKGDGKTYVFPYLVIEQADGLRGRLAEVFFAGWENGSQTNNTALPGLSPDMEFTYSTKTYKVVRGYKFPGASNSDAFNQPWALNGNNTSYATMPPLLAVRKA